MPDIPAILPDFVTVARIDPDMRGVRVRASGRLSHQHHRGRRKALHRHPAVHCGRACCRGCPPTSCRSCRGGPKTPASTSSASARPTWWHREKPDCRFQRRPQSDLHPSSVRLEFRHQRQIRLHGTDRNAAFRSAAADRPLRRSRPICPPEIVSGRHRCDPDGSDVTLTFAGRRDAAFLREHPAPVRGRRRPRRTVPPNAVDIMSLLPEEQSREVQPGAGRSGRSGCRPTVAAARASQDDARKLPPSARRCA